MWLATGLLHGRGAGLGDLGPWNRLLACKEFAIYRLEAYSTGRLTRWGAGRIMTGSSAWFWTASLAVARTGDFDFLSLCF